ncbi:hypothetical protein ACN9MU_13740 [Pseudoduganella sp. R-32]|uniref:hypothetical protein n=1 Tax=Pseudoduganella sp. R-32 TaxID=3404061 RepID=UPI003CF0BB21
MLSRLYPSAVLIAFAIVVTGCNSLSIKGDEELRVVVTGSSYTPPVPVPVWNVWKQIGTPYDFSVKTDALVENVPPNEKFALVVDLALWVPMAGQRETEVSELLHEIIKNSKKDTLELKVVAIPDSDSITTLKGGPYFTNISIDVKKYRDILRDFKPDNVGEELSSEERSKIRETRIFNPALNLGRGVIFFETGPNETDGRIGLSFWIDDRPVDELSINVCIKSSHYSCKRKQSDTHLGLLGQESQVKPDASLHIFEFDDKNFVGVFYCGTCGSGMTPGYQTWKSNSSFEKFQELFDQQFVPAYTASALYDRRATAADLQHQYEIAGEILFKMLFKSERHDGESVAAQAAFVSFVNQAGKAAKSSSRPPLLYTRIFARNRFPKLIPLNVMSIPSGEGLRFVGFDVNIESYFDLDGSSQSSQCIQKFASLLPMSSEDDMSLKNARAALGDWALRLDQPAHNSKVYESKDIAAFARWLAQGEEKDAVGIITLSHNYEEKLCFNSEKCDDSNTVYGGNIGKNFLLPSVAILDGCGTLKSDASWFGDYLASQGISTVIGTAANIRGEIGGHFLRIFLDILAEHRDDPAFTISDARFLAVRKLSSLIDESSNHRNPFGPAALSYMLVGNGALKMCPPPEVMPH